MYLLKIEMGYLILKNVEKYIADKRSIFYQVLIVQTNL